MITAAVAYYVPGLLRRASHPSAVSFTVIDNSAPPMTFVLQPGRTRHTSPGLACNSFRTWAKRLGGIDGGETNFDLLVQGKTSQAVYISGIGADVIARGSPTAGAVVNCPPSGTPPPRHVHLDLDTSTSGSFITKAAASPFDATVGMGKNETFDISAATRKCDCKWVLVVDLVVAGRSETVHVLDNGVPFNTTALSPKGPVYQWNYNNGWDVTGRPGERQIPAGQELEARRT